MVGCPGKRNRVDLASSRQGEVLIRGRRREIFGATSRDKIRLDGRVITLH